MKTIKNFAILMLGCLFAAASFTACSDNDDLNEHVSTVTVNDNYPLTDVQVMESGYISAELDAGAVTRAANGELRPEDVTVKQVSEAEAMAFDKNKDGKGGTGRYFNTYRWVTLRYKCTVADGTKKDLSELVVWPISFFGRKDQNPSQLIIGCHSTITSDKERPTNFSEQGELEEINMLALFSTGFSQSALVVIPDYEGYGSTAGSAHPYCNRELTAEQVVTGVKAGKNWFEKNVKTMKEGWSSIAIGYSQGGAVAAGVLRYCQEHHEDGLRIKGAVCGDGPYDPLATLKRYISMDKLYMPVAPALLLKGMVDTDEQMKRLGCVYQDFVTKEFYATNIFDMIQSKQKSTDDIQAALLKYSYQHGDEGGFTMMAQTKEGFKPYTPKNAVDASGRKLSYYLANGKGYNYCTVDQCFKPGVIAYFRDGKVTGDVPESKLRALEQALAKNALTYGDYQPGAGYTFFHSTGDEVVPFCNLESVRNTWGATTILASPYQSNTTYHVATGKTFFTIYCGKMVGRLFNNQWQPGEINVGNGLL